ncbi:MAG TPA: Dyp-type peroxidase [Thermoanaerobaculia bacterium]|jgi:putative iron-dependent peroxidase|nr:Dyp-type peroxidase [Thermoanaerobaculia bacterium]
MTDRSQPAILAPPPHVGRSLTFRIAPDADLRGALRRLRDGLSIDCGVIGLGEPAILALGKTIPGLRTFPAMSGAACSVPSTQEALCILLRGRDRGDVFDLTQHIRSLVDKAFLLVDSNDTFKYRDGRDLTRFEDGTENPKGKKAAKAAIVADGEHLRGSSFTVVQRWVHDLARFSGFEEAHRETLIGRRAESNEEIADAPPSAHVKRAEQESFDPEAFMLRRSMPWASATEEGLEFVAHVESLDRFERVLHRMVGHDDGIVDGLFSFSRPVTGGYYWCPPIEDGKLDLAILGI